MPAAPPWTPLYPFETKWFEVDGAAMHYVDEGPRGAPPLLFVHGNPTWSFHWRRLIAALSPRHRCVAVDHLGCGLSAKPDRTFRLEDRIEHLRLLIEHLDLSATTLAVQDWGGPIGLGAALRLPDRFVRLALFNTYAFAPPSIPWRIALCRTPVLGEMALRGANLFSLAALRMTLARRKELPPEVAAGYLAPYDSWEHRRAVYDFVMDIPASEKHPTWRTLETIESQLPRFAGLPTVLVWGMRDWCFHPGCIDRLLKSLPQAKVERVWDAGHWVVEDAESECLDALERLMETPISTTSATGPPR